MAKSRYAIEMDYKQALEKADELDDIAEDMANLANNSFQETLETLNENWKGDNATKYVNKGVLLQENICSTTGDLQSVAETVRSIAERIYRAEIRAWEVAHRRDY